MCVQDCNQLLATLGQGLFGTQREMCSPPKLLKLHNLTALSLCKKIFVSFSAPEEQVSTKGLSPAVIWKVKNLPDSYEVDCKGWPIILYWQWQPSSPTHFLFCLSNIGVFSYAPMSVDQTFSPMSDFSYLFSTWKSSKQTGFSIECHYERIHGKG